MAFVNHNGKLLDEKKALIGAGSRALRYGDGLFETIKANEGELVFAADHFERLWNGLERMKFGIPKHLTTERLEREIKELLGKNKHTKLARVRLEMMRGEGGLYDAVSPYPEYIIQTWPLHDNAGQWNSNGLVMGIYTEARKCRDAFSDIKHNNFLPYLMAALHAKEQKWNDAMLLNDAGRVCDSSIANIFIIKDKKITTAATNEGCIAGVMRKNIIRLLTERNIPVHETAITVDDLLGADEVFLSNSILNIRWVQRIGDKAYASSYIREIYAGILSTNLP